MKVVINTCFGGFGLSDKAVSEIGKRKGLKIKYKKSSFCIIYSINNEFFSPRTFFEDRTDKDLIDVIEKLGNDANDDYSSLKIIELPDDIEYYISNYAGLEEIHESHKIWR